MKLSECTKSVNSNVRESLFCASFHPVNRGMIVRSSLDVRTFGLSIVIAKRIAIGSPASWSAAAAE